MINKIKRSDYPELFEEIIEGDFEEHSYHEHRRGPTFYTRTIYLIDESNFPDFPKWHGYWETNAYVRSDDYTDLSEIDELNRVELKEKVVKTREWVRVEEDKIIQPEIIEEL